MLYNALLSYTKSRPMFLNFGGLMDTDLKEVCFNSRGLRLIFKNKVAGHTILIARLQIRVTQSEVK